jgi:hypothetical protein
MSKHSRTTPPNFTKAPEPSTPEEVLLDEGCGPAPDEAKDPHDPTGLNMHSGDYIDRAGVLRAQYDLTNAVAVHAELSEDAADLLAEFDRDMKAYRDMLVDALGPILPAYIPAVRVGAVSVRDTFSGGK